MKVPLFFFCLAKKWLGITFISLWPCTLNSLEVVFAGMLSKLNIEKASEILRLLNFSSTFYNIAFVYLLVMLWIVSSTCSSTFKLHLCNLFFRSVFNNINDFCASRICYSFDFVFSMFAVFLEKFNDPVWNKVLPLQ